MGFYGGKGPSRINGNLNVVGITSLGFFPTDTQTIERNITLSGDRIFYSVNKNLEFKDGTVLTVGSGSTIVFDRFNNLDDVRSKSLESPFIMSANIIEENFTIPSNYNAITVGPTLTVDSGVVITVSTGSNWSIVPE